MLRRDRQLRVQVYQFMDGGLFALGLCMAWLLRSEWTDIMALLGVRVDRIESFEGYFWLFLVVIPMTPLVLDWQGYYERPVFSPIKEIAWQLSKACLISAVGLILITFFLNQHLARSVFILFGFFSFGLMLAKEVVVRAAYKTKLGQAQFRRRILLAGAPEETRRLRTDIEHHLEDLEIAGEFDLNARSTDELVAALHEHSINAVVAAARHTYFGKVEKAIRACELEGIELWLLADFFETRISETSLDHFYGRPVLVFRCGTESSWPKLIKQILDFLGGLALLILFSPLMLATAVAIRLTSGKPVLFRQMRAGLNGKPFTMYKFRTMVTNAEQMQQELEQLNEMSGPVFKVTNDPRVTRVGRFLRKFSIDEFPQLFNVLRFEMSLVGPRPLPVAEVERFDDMSHRRRLSVRPGLTCMWQVSGRNDVTDFKDWVRMDLEYIDNWSLWLDAKILWRTIWVVLLGKGAR